MGLRKQLFAVGRPSLAFTSGACSPQKNDLGVFDSGITNELKVLLKFSTMPFCMDPVYPRVSTKDCTNEIGLGRGPDGLDGGGFVRVA